MKKKISIFIFIAVLASCSKDTNTSSGNTNPVNDPNALLQTGNASAVSCNSINGIGTIKSGTVFTEKGIVFSTSAAPTISDLKAKDPNPSTVISATKTGLLENTKYFYRAYIITSTGPVYGGEGSMTTPACGSSGGGGGGGGGGTNLIIDSNFFMEIIVDGQTHFLKQGSDGSNENALILAVQNSTKTWAISFKKGNTFNGINTEGSIPEIGSYSMNLSKEDAVGYTGNFSAPNTETTYTTEKYYTRSKASGSCTSTNNGYQSMTINITKKEAITGKGYRYILPMGGEYVEFNLNFAGTGGHIWEGTISGNLVKNNSSKDCVSDELIPYSGRFRLVAPIFQ